MIERIVDTVILGDGQCSRTGTRQHDRLGPSVNRRANQLPGRSLIDEHDLDGRKIRQRGHVELTADRVPLGEVSEEHDAIASHHAQETVIPTAERLKTIRICFRHVARRVDLVVQHDEHAPPLGDRGCRHLDGRPQVRGPLVAKGIRIPHGPHHDDGSVVLDGEMKEERRFLQRVGPAGHDDSCQPWVVLEHVVDAVRQLQPLVQGQVRACHIRELFVAQTGQLRGIRQCGLELLYGEAAAACVRNRSTSRHEVNSWERFLGQERRRHGRAEQHHQDCESTGLRAGCRHVTVPFGASLFVL